MVGTARADGSRKWCRDLDTVSRKSARSRPPSLPSSYIRSSEASAGNTVSATSLAGRAPEWMQFRTSENTSSASPETTMSRYADSMRK